MIFYRAYNNKLYNVEETNQLGFSYLDPSFIPDEYLSSGEFIILRTAHGIGDWGIISAMPRLLKLKYPKCKVYVPSLHLLKKLFGFEHNNAYNIFHNNPYVDKFIDSFSGDIFHDQYRIFNENNPNIPLVEQMLKFWQFEENEYEDSQPELYFTDEEKYLGDYIINTHSKGDFGCLLISYRFGTQCGKHDEKSFIRDTNNISKILRDNPLPYFYWSSKPLNETPFNYIKKALDLRHINLRVQLYIKSRAKINIGNQCGTNHLVVRYSNVFESQRQFPINHNFVKGEVYL
tara:strand:+ start:673 stop:1539 length:867 start_codon:yes stop_codon:yes gene_type:complete